MALPAGSYRDLGAYRRGPEVIWGPVLAVGLVALSFALWLRRQPPPRLGQCPCHCPAANRAGSTAGHDWARQ
jgi:hypothetical protein